MIYFNACWNMQMSHHWQISTWNTKGVKLILRSTSCRILKQRIKHFWLRCLDSSYLLKTWLSVRHRHVANLNVFKNSNISGFENSKQHLLSNTDCLFMVKFWNGLDRKNAIFVIVAQHFFVDGSILSFFIIKSLKVLAVGLFRMTSIKD